MSVAFDQVLAGVQLLGPRRRDLPRVAGARALSKRNTTCHGSPTWLGRSRPAPRNPGNRRGPPVSSALHSSNSASRPGATRRATVTVTGSPGPPPAAATRTAQPTSASQSRFSSAVADVHEEQRRRRAVERPVVVDQAEDAGRVDGDRVADGHRPPLDPVGAQDADVRLVDDRRRGVAGERAGVGDRERRPLHVVASRALPERAAAAISVIALGDPAHVELVGVLHHRHHETLLVEVDRDARG